jgi:hypothetical protein
VNESPPRRAVLLGAVAAVPLSACDVGSSDSGKGGPAPTRDADRALVDQAVEVEAALVALLTPLTRTGPERRRRRARATLRVHQDHLRLLEGNSPRRAETPSRRRDVGRAEAAVASAEDRAARRHRGAAGRAASGPFARVLAAMAAASAQQAQVWRS